jgi:hypothetical protein
MLSKKVLNEIDALILCLHGSGFLVFEINHIIKADLKHIWNVIDNK